MGIFSKFESKMEDSIEGPGGFFKTPISPVKITREAEKQMRRNLALGSGRRIAPTLYTVLINATDDDYLYNYYPSLAGETETYLKAKASQEGFDMECKPLVRFFREESLRRGKFEIIAEMVSAPVIDKLRKEEMEFYGISKNQAAPAAPAKSRSSDPFENVTFDQNKYNFQQPAPALVSESSLAPPPAPAPATPACQNISEQETLFVQDDSNHETKVISSPQHLRAILLETSVGREHPITKNLFSMGRDKFSDIPVNDINVSRHHAEIIQHADGSWNLIDKNSTNGTFVNGCKITQHVLHEGDKISLGNSHFQFFIK
ncbi:MAG: DUF3662 and FHA domain-containing protein [Eggerthellaceae bacterium]|nr:DUF3662 and FHA domain-containing protein [Eggerthellaceae bacterium]